ncbi:hypothetical protein ACLOJK_024636 [Asimina triloba]
MLIWFGKRGKTPDELITITIELLKLSQMTGKSIRYLTGMISSSSSFCVMIWGDFIHEWGIVWQLNYVMASYARFLWDAEEDDENEGEASKRASFFHADASSAPVTAAY